MVGCLVVSSGSRRERVAAGVPVGAGALDAPGARPPRSRDARCDAGRHAKDAAIPAARCQAFGRRVSGVA